MSEWTISQSDLDNLSSINATIKVNDVEGFVGMQVEQGDSIWIKISSGFKFYIREVRDYLAQGNINVTSTTIRSKIGTSPNQFVYARFDESNLSEGDTLITGTMPRIH